MTHDEAIERVAELAGGRHCCVDLSRECNLTTGSGTETVYKAYISGLDGIMGGKKMWGWCFGSSFEDVVAQVERAVKELGFAD